ncbi:MAG TPA: POTRA domain-containing protein, partial [Gammaproteobacteria bacterium]|nr:POTRA domain-containing protein [Gammaproteobacteria bacterium]
MIRRLAGLLLLAVSGLALATPPQVTVTVDGIEGSLLKNALAYLSINTYADSPTLTDSLVQRLHARAPDEIRQSLQP